jgi:HAD superfamily 5'-nucleotidase-like hydrolase
MGGDINSEIDALLSEVKREIDISTRRRIYCNRNIKMDGLEMIGWDMDYTLALYNQERLEQLSIELTLKKLIANHGYSEGILELDFRSDFAIRGIVIDCPTGNVFKMDKHGYVGRVFHGTRELTKEERAKQYRTGHRIRLSSKRYRWIDTLFGLPDASMYMTLVDWLDSQEKHPDYQQLFVDIRNSIDEAHRDDTLKTVIKADMPGFVVKDPGLAEMLHKFRSSGKKLFLLTNSYWNYTHEVMSYLLDGERNAYPTWRNYFDYVICAGSKPSFFNDRNPFLEVDVATGVPSKTPATELRGDQVYMNGNIHDFEEMTKVRGERVLYVGDHIYGDLIRLKKSRSWRTAMVLQELADENATSERFAMQIRDLEILDRRRRNLQSEIDYQVLLLKQIQRLMDTCDGSMRPRLSSAKEQARDTLESLRNRSKTMLEEVYSLERTIDLSYNPHWGAMFREGNEVSRFGQQVADYADLYTSRASNFLSYSPLRYFRAPRKTMPHEF